jgi:hypothetical protein
MLRVPSVQAQAVALLKSLRLRHIRLVLKNDELSFIAPKGSLRKQDIDAITALRAPIIEQLRSQGRARLGSGARAAPLTFSQLKHWRYHASTAAAALRDVALAVRLIGALDIAAMERAFAGLLQRHSALRTRVVLVNDVPEQQLIEAGPWALERVDLRARPAPIRLIEARRNIDALILAPVHFETGPLFAIRLITLEDTEHVLVIATEHIISDAVSVNILLNDLLSFYVEAAAGQSLLPASPPVQFIDYAQWQHTAHEAWLDAHWGYWSHLIARSEAVSFPADEASILAHRPGRAMARLKIGRDLKIQVRNRCREARTTLVMGVFAAYAACVLRWCRVAEALIGFQTDGRLTPHVQHSVGFFASTLYVPVRLDAQMTYAELLRQVTDEYRQASQHADACYLETVTPVPPFVGNTIFNWLPAETSGPASYEQRSLSIAPFQFENPSFSQTQIDREPLVLLYDGEDGVDITIYYSPRRLREERMQRFAQQWLWMLSRMAESPMARIEDLRVIEPYADALAAR